jgi:hypothetical protein
VADDFLEIKVEKTYLIGTSFVEMFKLSQWDFRKNKQIATK